MVIQPEVKAKRTLKRLKVIAIDALIRVLSNQIALFIVNKGWFYFKKLWLFLH